MKKLLSFFAFLAVGLTAFSQATTVNPARLLKPGANSTFLTTDGAGAVVWANAASLLVQGSGITISGNTISATDASASNELQTISAGDGSGSDRTITLSNSGGTITLAQGSGISLTRTGNTITVAASASAPTVTVQRYEEVPGSSTTTVTVSGFTPLTTDTMVFLDGVAMDWGSGEDITVSGSVITFASAVLAGQKVLVKKITVN